MSVKIRAFVRSFVRCSLALVGRGFSGVHFCSTSQSEILNKQTTDLTTDIVSALQYQLSKLCAPSQSQWVTQEVFDPARGLLLIAVNVKPLTTNFSQICLQPGLQASGEHSSFHLPQNVPHWRLCRCCHQWCCTERQANLKGHRKAGHG